MRSSGRSDRRDCRLALAMGLCVLLGSSMRIPK